MSTNQDRRRGLSVGATISRINAAAARFVPFVSIASKDDKRKATSQSTKMAGALQRRGSTYVRPPQSVVDKRRAANKRARQARAMHRRAGRR